MNGVVSAAFNRDKKVSYAELIGGRYFNVQLDWNKQWGNPLYAPGKAQPKKANEYKIVGKPIKREDLNGVVDGFRQAGRPGLVLCGAVPGATASQEPHRAHHGHPAAPAPAKVDGNHCPFAALSAPPLPPAAPAIVPPLRFGTAPPPLRQIESLARPALAAPPPPATGPPLPV